MDNLVCVSAAMLIDGKPVEKLAGAACDAPYVRCGVFALGSGRHAEIPFDARLDTGADITCVPMRCADALIPLQLGRSVLVRSHSGKVERVWTYLVEVAVYGYPDGQGVRFYKPRRGVLLVDCEIGLVGMDIMEDWGLSLDRSERRFSVEVI